MSDLSNKESDIAEGIKRKEELSFDLAAKLLGKLSTGRRLHILKVLTEANSMLPVSTIAALAGLTVQQASYNLVELHNYGFITRITSGRWSFYGINLELLRDLTAYLLPEEELHHD